MFFYFLKSLINSNIKKTKQNIYYMALLAMYNKASGLNIFIFKWLCTEIAKVIFGRSNKNKKLHVIKIHLSGLVAYKILINHLL